MGEAHLVGALNQALSDRMVDNDDVLVFGEDVGVNGGVFRVTDGLQDQFGDERVFDTPLAEAAIVGEAVGMAAVGLQPVPEIQFSGFAYPAFDQIASHLSRFQNRTRGEYPCNVTLRMPFTGGIEAPEHHSESMEMLYAHVPGLKVVVPSRPRRGYSLLQTAIEHPDPVVFLEPKRFYRTPKEELTEDGPDIGEAVVERQGQDVTLVCYGAMFQVTRKALKQHDTPDVELIDPCTIYPLDVETIRESVRKTGRLVVVQEAPKFGGFASELTAQINDDPDTFLHLQAPVKRVTPPHAPIPLAKLEDEYLPGQDAIVSALRETASF